MPERPHLNAFYITGRLAADPPPDGGDLIVTARLDGGTARIRLRLTQSARARARALRRGDTVYAEGALGVDPGGLYVRTHFLRHIRMDTQNTQGGTP